MPHARYSLKDASTGLYEMVSYVEYCARFPRVQNQLKFGTLEIFVQGMTCQYVDKCEHMRGFRAICQPKVLQAGNSSCIYSALADEVPELAEENLPALAEKIDQGLLYEAPDAHKANKRKAQKSFGGLPDNMYGVDGQCYGHQIHKAVAHKQQSILGNIHAVHVTCSNTGNQSRLQPALWTLIDSETDIYFGRPDETWVPR